MSAIKCEDEAAYIEDASAAVVEAPNPALMCQGKKV
jgi:hypothetical protein